MLAAKTGRSSIPQGLKALSWLTVAWMLLVILWGAVVRATGSGNGCGSRWPLCNGDFFPHHPGLATIIEFIHRSSTGICIGFVVALGLWTFLATTRGHPARRAWVWTVILLITESIFGAVLVLRGYVERNTSIARIIIQAIHFTNTLMLLGAMTLTAWFLTRRSSARTVGTSTLAASTIAVTVIVGAAGSLAALADTLFPSTSVLQGLTADFSSISPTLVRMRWLHPAAALISLILAWLLAARAKTAAARILMALVVIQLMLGIGDVFLLAPIWMQALHLLGADFFWMALVIVWSQSE